MDHLTFWQQFTMALAHGGPPCVVAYFAYLSIIKGQKKHAHELKTQIEKSSSGEK